MEGLMGKKRSGHSKKGSDWFGRPIIEHFNAKGQKTGYSKKGTDIWGTPRTERFNTKGEKTGYNKRSSTAFGTPVTERYNSKGDRIGYNKKRTTILGESVTERFNTKGEKTGYSKEGTSWGTPITEHFNTPQQVSAPGQRAAYDRSTQTESTGASGGTSSGSGSAVFATLALAVVAFVIGPRVWNNPTEPQKSSAQPEPISQSIYTNDSVPLEPEPVKVLFRDDATTIPSLVDTRDRILEAISQRDEAALLALVDSDVKIGFGGDFGLKAFADWLNEQDGWKGLEFVLRHGGKLEVGGTAFTAPYMWNPGETSSLKNAMDWVVAFDKTPVRLVPDSEGEVVAELSDEAVLQVGEPQPTDDSVSPRWIRVLAGNGQKGWVPMAAVYSNYDFRVSFSSKEPGHWVIAGVFSGD
jgi:hypothetical protein